MKIRKRLVIQISQQNQLMIMIKRAQDFIIQVCITHWSNIYFVFFFTSLKTFIRKWTCNGNLVKYSSLTMNNIILIVIYTVSVGASVRIIGEDNRCVDVRGDIDADGTTIQIFDCNGTPAQNFDFDSVDQTLRAFQFSKCFDVSSFDDGTPVQLNECFIRQNLSNIWNLNDAGDIVNRGSGKCLDARQPADVDSAVLQIWSCAGTPNQKWRTA